MKWLTINSTSAKNTIVFIVDTNENLKSKELIVNILVAIIQSPWEDNKPMTTVSLNINLFISLLSMPRVI
mgnify:CR=1 FL=1